MCPGSWYLFKHAQLHNNVDSTLVDRGARLTSLAQPAISYAVLTLVNYVSAESCTAVRRQTCRVDSLSDIIF
ncbi:unnamed protein product [Leptidea sinapis]|uniref:Uncharacterized protein n=1 Tax=Leptidea sinapis TaxID=189913 RepID=A0A5E4PPF3_9NEOP|nr:unnamed protein product [Leptidea sinapis]